MRVLMQLMTMVVLGFGTVNAMATPIITFDESTGTSASNNSQNVGWQFDVLDPISVTGLGWYDEGQDGLDTGHTIGIWDPAGLLLVSVILPGGTGAGLYDIYRKVNISEVHLDVGSGYIVGGLNFEDSLDRLASNVEQIVDPSIHFVSATFSLLTDNFERPTRTSTASNGFYGPMFFVANVPLPSSALLLMAGIMGLRA